MNAWSFRIIGLSIGLLVPITHSNLAPAQSSELPVQQPVETGLDFERDILPILDGCCFQCHGPERQESNYRLDVRKTALGTADYGDPPIVPGDSQASPLFQMVSGADDPRMPPHEAGAGLTDGQVELLRQWIDQGAAWPDEWAGESSPVLTTDHWSFQPLGQCQPPVVPDLATETFPLQNGIDHFISRRLDEQGIQPSAAADRVTLIRRIYLDMLGLYPAPEQVRAFVDDPAGDAWQRVIDAVLASHHYGERWARHWLDVVRFGESTGYEVNRDRANAWVYRDYVIDALNSDKSYRDFIVEQLAGDAAGVDEATGFLVGGPYDIVKSPDINLTLMQRQDELADYVNTTSTTFLGLTVGCAGVTTTNSIRYCSATIIRCKLFSPASGTANENCETGPAPKCWIG